MQLSGSTALVTGGGRRLGEAIALALATAGVHIALHFGHSAQEAEKVCDRIRLLGVKAVPLQADLADPTQTEPLLAQARTALGDIHILVNNAAIFSPGDLRNSTLDDWQRHLAINLTAPWLLMRAFAQQWPPSAARDHHPATVRGKIINIIDQRVLRSKPGHLAYTVSKSALWSLTTLAAQELAPGIQVNAIGPGPILPAADAAPATFARIAAATPAKRAGTPEEIGAAVLFLVQHDYIVGQLLCVDGGEHLGIA